jgi:hypothetical protein
LLKPLKTPIAKLHPRYGSRRAKRIGFLVRATGAAAGAP